ncbi:hypothetical protein LIER_10800 [Lithospermum erythrorhizon]|uniref:Morc S5 domain-containing protein n=1 Tax=Lithospermum erythrorhizon TaxID=34254 RepID=A0AAV3PPP0_LITER
MKIKEEVVDSIKRETLTPIISTSNNNFICISSSSSSSDGGLNAYNYSDEDSDVESSSTQRNNKRRRTLLDNVLPVGFLDPLTPEERIAMQASKVHANFKEKIIEDNDNGGAMFSDEVSSSSPLKGAGDNAGGAMFTDEVSTSSNGGGGDNGGSRKEWDVVKVEAEEEGEGEAVVPLATMAAPAGIRGCKQFWKAGDYQAIIADDSSSYSVGMDHVRVHPKFLHSNATSHKWALGAFAELLDNALDEACNGATYVHVDVLENMKEKGKMLLVEDNGGGMSPDKMRQCMSLGYSEKSKSANTIGQYGNGFKTSTMRLGADVIVFSRCQGKDGANATQSIGMLSYTFLTSTGKQDIIVPMIDYQKCEDTWILMARSSLDDWKRNLNTIVQWSPYENEEDLLHQFDFLEAQGTRIIIYNLWEDDTRMQELDFDADLTDIQIKGVNRDPKKITMAETYQNSRHFLTYRHSLRSYASILYLRIPTNFRIILRKQDVVHHSIVNDMMYCEEITYRPAPVQDEPQKDRNIFANVTVGFVKDAKYHIDIQGFNVYHKNRLIKPFWRVWNAAGSSGRGVIGVLEANFVEPAHDKQGFERTVVLSRLEARLVAMQKKFWRVNSYLIGYAKQRVAGEKEATPVAGDKSSTHPSSNGHVFNTNPSKFKPIRKPEAVSFHDAEMVIDNSEKRSRYHPGTSPFSAEPSMANHSSEGKATNNNSNGHSVVVSQEVLAKLKLENHELRESQQAMSLVLQFEKDRNKSLESQLEATKKSLDDLEKDQECILDQYLEEKGRRDVEEENMRKKLKEASDTIQQLLIKVNQLANRAPPPPTTVASCKIER